MKSRAIAIAVAALILSSAQPAFATAAAHVGEQSGSETPGKASNCANATKAQIQSADQTIRAADAAKTRSAEG